MKIARKYSIVFIAAFLVELFIFAAPPAYSANFPAPSTGCPVGSTLKITKQTISVPSGEFDTKEQEIEVRTCEYTPTPTTQCPTGTKLIGVKILPNGISAGGQCLADGSEEAKKAIQAESNVQDPIGGPGGSKCPDGFSYTKTRGKCYRNGSQELKDAIAGEKLLTPKLNRIDVSGYKTQIPIPCQPIAGGQCASPETPAGYIARLYQFGLMIVGFAAFAMIVYGGILYVFAAGDITKTSDAKDTITNAIYGLILFLGAYIILYTINPELVNLKNPQLEFLRIENLAPLPEPGGIATNGGLGSGGAGAGDPLCNFSVNGTIGVSVNAGSSSSSGDKTASTCVSCTANASKSGNGTCLCNAGFAEYSSTCISEAQCRNIKGTVTEKLFRGPTCDTSGTATKSKDDVDCIAKFGTCQLDNLKCDGTYESGLCRSNSAANYRCCVPR